LKNAGEPLDAPPVPAAAAEPGKLGRRVRAKADAAADKVTAEAGIVASAQAARGDAPARPFGKLPEHGPGFDRITTSIFTLPDPSAEYEALEAALKVGTQEFTRIADAMDNAEDNARRAHRLYVNARLDAERFNIDADVIEAAMRTPALHALEADKLAGVRTKQITDTDVASKIAALFPDEHRDLAERRIKSRKMVEHLETFAQLWRSRCYSISKMLESKR
jgi:hypothetical protein